MSFTYITANGEVISSDNAGPWQYTPEGFNSGLPTSSRPFAEWIAGAGTYQRLYERQVWVKVMVDKLTYQTARLPLKVYEGLSPNKQRLLEGPLYDAIRNPAPRKRTPALWQWAMKPLLIHGASALRIVRNPVLPAGFRPLYWQWLEPRTIGDVAGAEIDYFVYTPPNGKREIIQPEDVLLIEWESLDGTIGKSPLKPLLDTLRIEFAAKRYQEQMLRNGVRPPGGVSWGDNEKLLKLVQDPEFRRRFEEELGRLVGGVENAGKPIMLPPGAKWMSFAYNASDAELIAQRQLTPVEVAAAFDISPPLVGLLKDVNMSALQALIPGLFQTTLPPYLTLIQEAIGAQVIDPTPTFAGQSVEADLGDVLRGDPQAEAEALKTLVMIGVRTINEARAKLNLPPINHPDADRPLIPVNNMTFLGGTPLRDPASEPNGQQAETLLRNMTRAGDRVYRRLKAGEPDAWDPERFERELAADLTEAGANGSAARDAKAWAAFVGAVVDDAGGDPDTVRAAFAALTTQEPS